MFFFPLFFSFFYVGNGKILIIQGLRAAQYLNFIGKTLVCSTE